MNVMAPVSSIMSTKLLTVNPKDKLEVVKSLFDNNRIHHLPVVRHKTIVGLISKTDLLFFLRGTINDTNGENYFNSIRLENFYAEDIMTKGLAKIESTTRIAVALEVFKENRFHSIPVVDNGELVGIITVYDIVKALSEAPITDSCNAVSKS